MLVSSQWRSPLAGALVLGVACTAAPESLDLQVENRDAHEHATTRWWYTPHEEQTAVAAPNGEDVVADEISPHVAAPAPAEPGTMDEQREPRYVLVEGDPYGNCLTVTSRGMPAIDVTGTLVATSFEHLLQGSHWHGEIELRITNLDAPEESKAVTILTAREGRFDEERACRVVRRRVRSRVQAANATLEAHQFKSLQWLRVGFWEPEADPEEYTNPPPRERPLQVAVQGSEVIVRVPGVKVHERHPVRRRDPTSLYAVHGHRETGVVVLTFSDCAGDSCTCDPLLSSEIVRWTDSTFATLEQQPCTDPGATDGRCRPFLYHTELEVRENF
jgi:hypothetical protein